MKYSGIDLHSNNSVVVATDEQDRVLVSKRLPNQLEGVQVAPTDKAEPRAVEVVTVELVDHGAERTRTHELVEHLVLEEQVDAAESLVRIVPTDDARIRGRVVRLADPRDQHQPCVVEHIGREQDDLGRLLELAAP
jgi:hypothetical protein